MTVYRDRTSLAYLCRHQPVTTTAPAVPEPTPEPEQPGGPREVARWRINLTDDLVITSYDDNGNPRATPLIIDRDTGRATIVSDPTSPLEIATKQYVDTHAGGGSGTAPPPSDSSPLMDGVAQPGTYVQYSRGDHRHPSDTSRLALAGGVMTGPIALSGLPTDPSHAASKQYVDSFAGSGANPSNTPPLMNGPASPGVSLLYSRDDHRHPSDTSRLALAGGTMTGPLILSGDPTSVLQAATKQYVDAQTSGATTTFDYTYNINAPPPSSGQLRMNNANQALATALTPHYQTFPGTNVKNLILQTIQIDDEIYLQDQDNPDQWQKYRVTALPVDNGTYATLAVAQIAGGTGLSAGRILFTILPRAGAGGVPEAPDDGQTYGRKSLDWVAIDTSIDWTEVTGKPVTFPPAPHSHPHTDITDFNTAAAAVAPVQSVSGKTGTVTLVKADVGLGNVDNTSDVNKPVSTAQAAADALRQLSSEKGQASGYAPLDAGAKVPATYLPAYVDDVVEYANLAAFPTTGTPGTIYVALDTGKIYRWSGTAYIEISPSPGSTDAVPEGSVNLYYTDARAAAAAPVQSVAGRTGTVTLTKADVGLSNVDNTADLAKPISTATQAALDTKAAISYVDSVAYSDEKVDDRVATLLQAGSNITLTYDDTAGTLTIASTSSGGTATVISDTPPANPTNGSMWWESDTGILWIYYNDGTSSQWVAITSDNGLGEAPTDGALYGRAGAAWAKGVKLVGDTMTGPLILSGAPSDPLQAATKAYVDANSTAGAVRYDAAQSLTAAQAEQARTNIVAAPVEVLTNINLGINGSMTVSQLYGYDTGVQLAGGSSNVWVADMFNAVQNSASAILTATCQSSGPVGAINSIRLDGSKAGFTTVGATDYCLLIYNIEGTRWRKLLFGYAAALPVSISFWIFSALTGTFALTLRNGGANRTYAVPFTVNAAATWEYKTVTIPGDIAGTWAKDAAVGVSLIWSVVCGTTYQLTPNQWSSTNGFGVFGQTNLLPNTSSYFYVSGVHVLAGNTPMSLARAPYAFRPYADELRDCLRYYWRWNDPPILGENVSTGVNNSYVTFPFFYPAVMRATPSISLAGMGWISGGVNNPTVIFSNDTAATLGALSNSAAGGRIFFQKSSGSIIVDARI